MRLIKKIKKGMAVILSTALMAGLVPFMPHSVSKVQAAAGSKKPSVTAYATKEQLMDKTFTPNYKEYRILSVSWHLVMMKTEIYRNGIFLERMGV